MKLDVLIIRIGFVALLAMVGYLLNPLSRTTHLAETVGYEARQIISAILGILIALVVIAFEMRTRQASLKTLIGAAIGSILGIIGSYLIGMLISTQETTAVTAEMKTFLTVALAFFMAYIGLMVGAAKGEFETLSTHIAALKRYLECVDIVFE